MTGIYYLLAAVAVLWLGLWVAEDDKPIGNSLKMLGKNNPWFPFEFIEPVPKLREFIK